MCFVEWSEKELEKKKRHSTSFHLKISYRLICEDKNEMMEKDSGEMEEEHTKGHSSC